MRASVVAALGFIICGSFASGQVAHDLTLQVSDDAGRPLTGAQATITFLKIGDPDVNSGLTDERGQYGARTAMSLGTYLQVEKSGHYPAQLNNLNNFRIPEGKATMIFVLPRVTAPVALHAARIEYAKLPVQGEWIGFDLALGDWVSPHGKGSVSDMRFRFTNQFEGWTIDDVKLLEARRLNRDKTDSEIRFFYGHWHGVLEVSFPNPQEGLIEEQERYWYYNQLRLPHRAPESGYGPGKRFEADTAGPREPDRLVGYFLRTRVKLDSTGQIVSAHYAKVYEDFRFDPRGTVSFWYYYNPTPNDRNLEFDPMRNLFPRSMNGTNVAQP